MIEGYCAELASADAVGRRGCVGVCTEMANAISAVSTALRQRMASRATTDGTMRATFTAADDGSLCVRSALLAKGRRA